MRSSEKNKKKLGRPRLPYESCRFNLHWPKPVGEWIKKSKDNKKRVIDFVERIIGRTDD